MWAIRRATKAAGEAGGVLRINRATGSPNAEGSPCNCLELGKHQSFEDYLVFSSEQRTLCVFEQSGR